MKILVSGACGYIGGIFTDYALRDTEHKVFALDNLSTGAPNALHKDAALLKADIGDMKKCAAYAKNSGAEAVFHFAGKIVPAESVENPELYYSENAVKTFNFARAAISAGVKYFILSSSAAVYGEPVKYGPVEEGSVLNPITPYGASKLIGERMVADLCAKAGVKFAILRYFNVAGARPDGKLGCGATFAKHLIQSCCEAIIGRQDSLKIYGDDYPTPDGTGVRDYIHVCDVARAHLAVLEYLRDGGPSDVFNVGYGKGHSVLDVCRAFKRVTGRAMPAEIKPRRLGDCAYMVASNSKILSNTNWRPLYDNIDTIVKHSLAWEIYKLRKSKSAPKRASKKK